jgi:hypothetical protein
MTNKRTTLEDVFHVVRRYVDEQLPGRLAVRVRIDLTDGDSIRAPVPPECGVMLGDDPPGKPGK